MVTTTSQTIVLDEILNVRCLQLENHPFKCAAVISGSIISCFITRKRLKEKFLINLLNDILFHDHLTDHLMPIDRTQYHQQIIGVHNETFGF